MVTTGSSCAALAATVLLLGTGCGSATEPGSSGSAGTVVLEAVCPVVHTSYDALVSSAPTSQQDFVAALERIRVEADAATRAALAPLQVAARELAAAGRGDGYAAARDDVFTAVAGLSDRCAEVGRPILHPGH